MIDKLEVRVPATAEFTGDFSELYAELRTEPKLDPFKGSRHYLATGDLRPFGYGSIVHLHCKHGEQGNHKVEVLETGKMGLREMTHEVRRIFNLPMRPDQLEVMRVDLAADVSDVPVTWFKDRVRVHFKRFGCEIGTYMQMGRGVETLYFGKRPNCYRIYDKAHEREEGYRKMLGKVSPDAEVPSYEEVYGHTRDAVITRVERQMGGGRVPLEIGMLGTLRKNAVHFNPFEPFEIGVAGRPEPRPCDYPVQTYAAGMWLRERAHDWGKHQLRSWLNKHSKGGHGSRVLDSFADFMPEEAPVELTSARLFELYRDSVSKQLAA